MERSNTQQDETMHEEPNPITYKKATEFVKQNTNLFNNEQKLKLYALFKQSTVGNCNTEKPGGLFNWERKSMWEEWNNLKFKNILYPKQMYVDYLESQVPGWEHN